MCKKTNKSTERRVAFLAAKSDGKGAGYCVVALEPNAMKADFTAFPTGTTANALILHAAINAMKAVPEGGECEIVSSSQYLVHNLQFNTKWIANDWTAAAGTPVANQDLWKEIAKLKDERNVTFTYSRDKKRRGKRDHVKTAVSFCAVGVALGKSVTYVEVGGTQPPTDKAA